MLGAGGAILMLPALVYLLGQDVPTAASTSLLVVGTNAVIATLGHSRAGRVDWSAVPPFAGAGFLGALAGARLNSLVPGPVVMLVFAGVLLLSAGVVLRGGMFVMRPDRTAWSRGSLVARTAGLGAAVGLLVGFLGVGGGFLIVPTLVGFLGFPMSQAVGTSAALIMLNAGSGIVGHAIFGTLAFAEALPLVVGGAIGILIGVRLVGRLADATLRRMFGVLLFALAAFLLVQNVSAIVGAS